MHDAEAIQDTIDTVTCPTCGSPAGLACAARGRRDTPPVPVATSVPHPERMHAAGYPCEPGCAACPHLLVMRPSTTWHDKAGHWESVAAVRVGTHRYDIGYVDPLGTTRRDGREQSGPYAYAIALPAVITAAAQRTTRPELTVTTGATLLIDGRAYQVSNDGPDRIRLDPSPHQPPRPSTTRSDAADIARALDDAFDHIDSATRTIEQRLDLDDPHAGPGTTRYTLGTMLRRITEAIEELRAVADHAEALADR